MFVGSYQRSLDAKGRLLVPAKLLRKLPAAGGQITLLVMLQGDRLAVFPPEAFDKRLEEQRGSGFDVDDDLTAMMSLVEETTLDAANRLRLISDHIREAKLGREVVLVGAGDHLQIRRPEDVESIRRRYLKKRGGSEAGA